MIPLHDRNPTRAFPAVCILLIAVNVIVFLIDQSRAALLVEVVQTPYGPRRVGHEIGGLSLQYAMIPALVTGAAQSSPFNAPTVQPAWLSIFTSMFLHANWLHLGGNMLYLWIFGNNIEDVLGKGRFVFFYLICGTGAAALHIASNPASVTPTVGASGAVAGLMGAYLLLFPGTQILTLVPIFVFGMFFELPALVIIGYWFLIQFLNAQVLGGGGMLQEGGVAYLAHVGGFVAGMLLIILLGGRRLLPPRPSRGFDEDYSESRWRRDA